jgi:uncharacterized protein (DUF2141 family)
MNLAIPPLATQLTLAFTLLAAPMQCLAGELLLNVSNIKNAKGHLLISVFDAESSFKSKTNPIASQTIAADKGAIEIVFRDLSPGPIAVAVFHDKNNNSKLDTNFLGMPKEGFAFSNNPKTKFGPPTYGQCTFELVSETTQIALKMKY